MSLSVLSSPILDRFPAVARLVVASFFTPTSGGWGLPVLFSGEPGGSKSSVVEALADQLFGVDCEVLAPGERGDAAFGVIPVPVGGVVTQPPPEWAVQMGARGLVFVDEVTTAPPMLQPALLGLLGAKRIGGMQLPGGVRVVGACNPPESAAAGYDLSPPLANRFIHVEWPLPSVEEHARYMMGRSIARDALDNKASRLDVSAVEAEVLAAWPAAWADAVGAECAFLRAQPHVKNQYPKGNAERSSRAWPSDRTWELATRCIAASRVFGLTAEERGTLVGGCIGAEAYDAFGAYLDKLDLPDTAALLDGKVHWAHDPERLDRSYAVLTAASALLVSMDKDKTARIARGRAFYTLAQSVAKTDADLTVAAAQALLTVPNMVTDVPESRVFMPMIQPMLSAAAARS